MAKNQRSADKIEKERPPIGKWIRATREKRCETQEEAAKAIGVHAMTLVKWETGSRSPGLTSLILLAKWGGVSLGDLVAL